MNPEEIMNQLKDAIHAAIDQVFDQVAGGPAPKEGPAPEQAPIEEMAAK